MNKGVLGFGQVAGRKAFLFVFLLLIGCGARIESQGTSAEQLTIVALGDTGENSSILRANASTITDMYTGTYGGENFSAMLFLGDNFYPTGLNVPFADVERKVKSVLGKFKTPFSGLGRNNVHAVAGNHDYYARLALDKSVFLGLVTIQEGPIGFTSRGNEREAAIPDWTYYYGMPANAFYPLSPNATDSVQLIFFDSAVLLRTDTLSWRPALDSLYTLLALTKARPSIAWRILVAHHPFHSVGEHGGYTEWNDETNQVDYLTQCDKDTNALGWLKNWVDPEDACASKYQQYVNSVNKIIKKSGAKVQLVLSGHDHSLQLLYYPWRVEDCDGCPKVQIVSGAGSDRSRVKLPSPPNEFTSAQTKPSEKGMAIPGFVQLKFDQNRLRAVFFSADRGDRIDMGDGRTEFWIDVNGTLLIK